MVSDGPRCSKTMVRNGLRGSVMDFDDLQWSWSTKVSDGLWSSLMVLDGLQRLLMVSDGV